MSDSRSEPQWHRWWPEAFGAADPDDDALPLHSAAAAAECTESAWRAELARLRQQAESRGFDNGLQAGRDQGEKQGYQQGFTDGRNAGLAQGLEEARAEQREITARMSALLDNLAISLDGLDRIIPSQLMQIALTVAAKIIGQTPPCDPIALRGQIEQLLHHQPLLGEGIRLCLHPDDLPLLAPHLTATLAQQGWRVQADGQIRRGGCRVLADNGELDATLESRWQQLCALLQEEVPS